MDKIGGEGPHGEFYTRKNWGKPDQPNIWSEGSPSDLSENIDWVLEEEGGIWGADDDTDIEYIYQSLLLKHQTSVLSGEQIRDGWMRHIFQMRTLRLRTQTVKKKTFCGYPISEHTI